MDGGAGSNRYLEVLENREQSFKPVTAFNGWRVAVLNYFDMVAPKSLKKVERHMETDEVFVLLSGSACLITGTDGDAPYQLTVTAMQPHKVYNVRQGVWHHIILSPVATVLIVENEDTTEKNSEYQPISAEELALLRGAVNYCIESGEGV